MIKGDKGNGKLKRLIRRFPQARILVIGDLILDEFVWGTVERISPEAPVPVVAVNAESCMPGGAANVANNVHALGGQVTVAGVIGDDRAGGVLLDELKKRQMDIEGVVVDRERPTTIKTRVIAHHQQVVRFDRETTQPIANHFIDQLVDFTREHIHEIDGVIIEDYGKGVITSHVLRELIPLAKQYRKIITVDPKEEHVHFYTGITAMTPNRHEAGRIAGLNITDDASLQQAARAIVRRLKSDAVLVTLGEDGMFLLERTGRKTYIPTVAQAVFDVAGAGDTAIAAFSLALASGASMTEAAHLANYAAGIVVGKVGTAVATPDELLARLGQKPSKLAGQGSRVKGQGRSRPLHPSPFTLHRI